MNVPYSNPKPDLHNINAHIKFGQKSVAMYSSCSPETKILMSQADTSNQISTISMHTPSLVKIHAHLLKLSYGKENMDGHMRDRQGQMINVKPTYLCGVVKKIECAAHALPWQNPLLMLLIA